MSLQVAFNQARQSILSINTDFALTGRNIAGANDPVHSRVVAERVTTFENGARIVGIRRTVDESLAVRMLSATSTAAAERALADGLSRLAATVGDPADGGSPAARIGELAGALLDFANAPEELTLGLEAVEAAREVVRSLVEAAGTVLAVREEADAAMARAAGDLASLLSAFGNLNDRIREGTVLGRDVTLLLDQRDALVARMSEHLGVTTQIRDNNDMALFTDSGVTLFDTSARAIAFAPTATYAPGATGNAFFVDGVAVAGPGAVMPVRTGALVGLAALRDEVAVTFERQIDEIARALVAQFQEAGVPGLFTWSGGTVPGGPTPGVAAGLGLDPAFDPTAGGDVARLRDGNAVLYNPGGFSGFSDRLRSLHAGLSAPFAFDPAAGIPSIGGIEGFSIASVAWLEERRSAAVARAEYEDTLVRRAAEALSNATGVNLDDEYAFQLELERSFAASSKLIGVIDGLFEILFRDLR